MLFVYTAQLPLYIALRPRCARCADDRFRCHGGAGRDHRRKLLIAVISLMTLKDREEKNSRRRLPAKLAVGARRETLAVRVLIMISSVTDSNVYMTN